MLLAAAASAQTLPTLPVLPTVPPVRPIVSVPPVTVDVQTILQTVQKATEETRIAVDQAREWRLLTPDIHLDLDALRWPLDALQTGPFMTMSGVGSAQAADSSNYNSGLSLMSQHKYDEAIVRFDKVVAAKGPHADGAMYHKAYCQSRLGKSDEAVATLGELRKSYPQSGYLKDARALEADVKKLGPGQVDDDDIKLLAIQGIQHQNPDQAIPAIEGVLSKSTNSLQIKQNALFVLAGIDNPRAHQVLLGYAKGSGNPDLQRKAISYLGTRGQKTSGAELIDIYNSTTDADVRLAVIGAFRSAGDKTSLLHIASGMGVGALPNITIDRRPGTTVSTAAVGGAAVAERSKAISGLADLASPQELWPLYQKEENKDLRSQWVSVFAGMGAVDQLMQIVKTEKEPAVKLQAIRALGRLKPEKTGATLVEMYGTGDKDTRKAVIAALSSQNNAESLVAIARKESDPELKREIVSRLAEMAKSSKVAMDYLMEIIK
jgi:HEAT repeat protein